MAISEAELLTQLRGAKPHFACRCDPRFSYCLRVPSSYDPANDRHHPVLVLIHGTDRNPEILRDRYSDFAESNDLFIVAPLFPAGITAPWELSSYKFLAADGIRFDLILLAMLDEIAEQFSIDTHNLLLHGFSGGGQFANRFLYAHPNRLRVISIGAPGLPTLLDFDRAWWTGVKNFAEIFGKEIDLDAIRRIAIQIVVGERDTDPWDVTVAKDSALWMDGANDTGETRTERAKSLQRSMEDHGIIAQLDLISGVSHESDKIERAVTRFFSDHLTH